MNYFDIKSAVDHAEREIRAVRDNAYQLGALASKPFVLRNFSVNDLIKIKKQLKAFNMHTYEWKEQ